MGRDVEVRQRQMIAHDKVPIGEVCIQYGTGGADLGGRQAGDGLVLVLAHEALADPLIERQHGENPPLLARPEHPLQHLVTLLRRGAEQVAAERFREVDVDCRGLVKDDIAVDHHRRQPVRVQLQELGRVALALKEIDAHALDVDA